MSNSKQAMTGKERARLRAEANGLDVIIQIGKSGLSENLLKQLDGALTTRELIKGQALETSPISAREAAQQLSDAAGAEIIQVIGRRFVLYRFNPDNHDSK